jgi:hypothetical protein
MKPLSNKALRDLLPREMQYKHFMGQGLYILVRPNGSKYWRLDYRFAGKRFTLSLGIYPDVTLENAINIRDNTLDILKSGTNPKHKFLNDKQAIKDSKSKQIKPTRFLIENDGNLHIRLGKRVVYLTAIEANELSKFLDSTKQIIHSEI